MERPETTSFVRKRLPHWEVVGGRYFVTIRLKGSIPDSAMKQISAHRAHLESLTEESELLEARRTLFREMEKWLDIAPEIRHLENPEIAKIVMDSLRDREERGIWMLYAFTIMPNHIHFFVGLNDARLTPELVRESSVAARQPRDFLVHQIETFKRWTATHATRVLNVDGSSFWQREWFDHWSRSVEHDERILRYIRNNAVKAGLVTRAEDWPFWWERPKDSQ